jgi:type VI secretion system protein ImpG
LFCTPVVNLFPKEEKSLEIKVQASEHHIVADKALPLNFEIYALTGLSGSEDEEGQGNQQEFHAIHTALGSDDGENKPYFSMRREPHMVLEATRRQGQRTNYVGSEAFVSLTDPNRQPYRHALKSLSVELLCTNRDLAFLIPRDGQSDFNTQASVPVESVKLLRGPTEPKQALANGAAAWRFISHLNVNYLTLIDSNPSEGAAALRELLSLYAPLADQSVKKHIEAIRHCSVKPVTRRLPTKGQIAVGRGVSIDLTVDESLFDGVSPYLLGSILEQFFPRHVGQNSFTETVLHSVQRGEIARWKLRMGNRPIA